MSQSHCQKTWEEAYLTDGFCPCLCPPALTQENIDRLENGLAKLQKVQGDVDVLVEAAKEMAVQVELKVASANVFAEQVRAAAVTLVHSSVRSAHGCG